MSKALFYLEPHPIRNSMEHFADVVDNISSIFKRNIDNKIQIYSNTQTLDRLAKKNFISPSTFLFPKDSEQSFFESQLQNWTAGGMSTWVSLLDGSSSSLINSYQKILQRLAEENNFEYIFYWGTNYAVSDFCKQNKIKALALELGCSRLPFLDTIVADPKGVNGNSFVSDLSIEDLPEYGWIDWLSELTCKNQTIYQNSFEYTRFNQLNDLCGKRVAFIPLQLFDDANLLIFSPFSTLREFVSHILPPLLKAGYLCVFKEHPGSKFRPGAQESNLEAKLYAFSQSLNQIVWIGSGEESPSNCFFYKNCNLVVTNNSSAGFEGLIFGLPVIVIGDAGYKIKGVFPSLEEYLEGNFEEDVYLKKINKLLTFFYKDYLIEKEVATQSLAFGEKLKSIARISEGRSSSLELLNKFLAINKKEEKR